jgi:cytochrome P450
MAHKKLRTHIRFSGCFWGTALLTRCSYRHNAEEHLSLGQGMHYCLGAPLARLETRVVLEELSARLPRLRLVPGQTLRFRPNTTFRAPLALLVEWDTSR